MPSHEFVLPDSDIRRSQVKDCLNSEWLHCLFCSMASKTKRSKASTKRGIIIRFIKRTFLYLFITHLVYILICWVCNPPITITQLVSATTGHGLKRDYVSLENISPYARLAVIASEDQRYPQHDGVDWKSMEKAEEYNKTHKQKRGASTISQQTAKNVFLWQHGGYFRKGLELYFTFVIETLYSKRRILELYLNVIEMGDGIFGIEAASQAYFGKSAKTLTRPEAAMIAACLPNPKEWTVKPMSKMVARRYPRILKQMSFLEPLPEVQALMK